jgi:hypothetical protein
MEAYINKAAFYACIILPEQDICEEMWCPAADGSSDMAWSGEQPDRQGGTNAGQKGGAGG